MKREKHVIIEDINGEESFEHIILEYDPLIGVEEEDTKPRYCCGIEIMTRLFRLLRLISEL
jgi:hypothetical protein|uniref:Uncharacterized protein n=1 Tax=viral metagenome TaxID=1070528 RepID=A0A6C0BUA9_9ZZZZ